MIKRMMKKAMVGLSAALLVVFGSAIAVSASDSMLVPENVNEINKDMTISAPLKQAFAAPDAIGQVGITKTSMDIAWTAVDGAEGYQVEISNFANGTYTVLGLTDKTAARITDRSPGTIYYVRVFAFSQSDQYGYYSKTLTCGTLSGAVGVKNTKYGEVNCLITMKTAPDTVNGYRVQYYNYNTGKTETKYFAETSFLKSLSRKGFYKVTITPYTIIGSTRHYSPDKTVRYISLQPKLSKKSSTNTSMTVKWSKVKGATSYTVYVKKPGGSYKKVKTTTGTSYKVSKMKSNKKYYIKVIANKKVGKTTWRSSNREASYMLIQR